MSKRMGIIAAFSIAATFWGSPASADISLCNKSGRPIWAAFGNKSDGSFDENNLIVGWFRIEHNQCTKAFTGCHCTGWDWFWGECYWDYVFHAHDDAGVTWSAGQHGTAQVCNTNDAFWEDPHFSYQGWSCPAGRIWRPWGINSYPDSSFCNFTFNFNP